MYADINALLIRAIIEEKSSRNLRGFAKEKIFDPLDIKEFYWYTNAANQTGAAGNLYLWASGNGGNHLVLVPEENLIISMISRAHGNWFPHTRACFILGKVLQALEEKD